MNNYIEILFKYKDFALICIIFLLFVLNIVSFLKVKRLVKGFRSIINGVAGTDLEKNILFYFSDVINMKKDVSDIKSNIRKIEDELSICIKKISLLRYNAFDDVSSSLSFVVVLLDNYDNGVVINSIYSRESTTCYAKPIQNGNSKYPLSTEEIQAVEIAKTNYIEKTTLKTN